ncbi:MAG: helix-turn-helix domain-containing protein [Actinomycetota bacterium]|nr:helix-turn-helix domain-containing protein [Actinomycetota bacterium]
MRHVASDTQANQAQTGRATPSLDGLDGLPPVLTASQVAELLHLNTDYVRKLARDGAIPAHRLPHGRAIRFLRDEVAAWLQALPGPDRTMSVD